MAKEKAKDEVVREEHKTNIYYYYLFYLRMGVSRC
jgi:hypothetical protein